METSDLRKAILQYAMEGNLVKQDPNDEPTSILLEKIKQEKEKLIKEGKIKRDKNESIIYKGDDNHYYEKIGNYTADITDEIPFEVPYNWIWTRGKNLYKIVEGFSFKSNEYTDDGIKVVRISDFDYDGIKESGFRRYAYSERLDNFKIISEDILICMTGGTVGKNCYVTEINEDSYINQRVGIIRSSQFIKQKYIFYFLNTSYVKQYISAKKNSTNDNISSNDLESLFVPLPQISEQERIVRKLDELMPLVDEYEKLLAENEQLDNEFPDKLKQSILQYAIEGKLVKQDPNDEPASILLEKIKQEKEKLIKEGKIKRDKNESIIYQGDDNHYYEKIGRKVSDITEEIPFEIPETWRFVRLLDICSVLPTRNNQIDEKDVLKEGDVPVISQSKNLIDGYTNQIGKKLTIEKPIILFGDHTKVVKYIDFDFVVGADGTKLLEPCAIDSKWFYYNMICLATQIKDRGYARHFILLKNSLVSLPPLQEQAKISAKLDYIFNLLIK